LGIPRLGVVMFDDILHVRLTIDSTRQPDQPSGDLGTNDDGPRWHVLPVIE
jgi:hypothetical protein